MCVLCGDYWLCVVFCVLLWGCGGSIRFWFYFFVFLKSEYIKEFELINAFGFGTYKNTKNTKPPHSNKKKGTPLQPRKNTQELSTNEQNSRLWRLNKMTYEQRRKQKLEQRHIKIDRLIKLLEKLGYTHQPTEQYKADAKGTLKDQTIILDAEHYQKPGMIHVSGRFPRDEDNTYFGVEGTQNSININYDKTNEQITKDIKTRFLPSYLKTLEEVQQKISANNKRKHDREHTMQLLGTILSLKPYNQNRSYPKLHEYEYNRAVKNIDVQIDCFATEITFEVRIRKDAAMILAKFIKDLKA